MASDIERFEETSLELYSQVRGRLPVSDALVEQYLPRVRAFVRARLGADLQRRETDSDIVQSVFRSLLDDRERLSFETEARFRSWLFTAALNKIRMKARYWEQERRSPKNEADLGSDESCAELFQGYSGVLTPSRIASAREQVERLEDAMELLSEEHREVIALVRVARLSYAEVALRMTRSPDAVRKILGRALRNLATFLECSPPHSREDGGRGS